MTVRIQGYEPVFFPTTLKEIELTGRILATKGIAKWLPSQNWKDYNIYYVQISSISHL